MKEAEVLSDQRIDNGWVLVCVLLITAIMLMREVMIVDMVVIVKVCKGGMAMVHQSEMAVACAVAIVTAMQTKCLCPTQRHGGEGEEKQAGLR